MGKASPPRLVILAGPSCVGKTPLYHALERLHPELAAGLQPLVLYNDRSARPGERDGVDYHFRSRGHIAALEHNPDFVVMEVRADLQALDLEALRAQLGRGDVLFEGNPFVGRLLLRHPALDAVSRLSVFISPVSADELGAREAKGDDPRSYVTDIMRNKLLGRTRKQKGALSPADLEDIELRAASAWTELRFAHEFQHVIPNRDGEDSAHWDAVPAPLGDAGKALETFVALLRGEPAETERWTVDTLA